MTRGELLTRFSVDADSRLSMGRVLDKLDHTARRDVPGNTRFLTDGEQALAEGMLAACGHPSHLFYGGYAGASRRVCIFLPTWQEAFIPGGEDDPLGAMVIPIPRDSGLSHRDFLGSMMGLGITRDLTGDILVGEDRCQVVCLKMALPILLSQWDQVGRYPVKPAELPLEELTPVAVKVAVLRETFQSLRFDAVASAAFRISRAKAAALIAGGHLEVNHLPCVKPDRVLREGDVLTGKGYGKCVLARVTGQSKKGRIMAELERFV